MRIISRLGVAFSAAATFALSTQLAFGADLYTPEDTPPPADLTHPAPPDWTGFYVGTAVGWGWTNNKANTTGNADFESAIPTFYPSSLGLSDNGFYGGLTAGYNRQFNRFVFGVEADIAYMGLDETNSFIGELIPDTPQFRTEAQHQMEFFGTFRGRAGMAFSRKAMIFGTAGLAAGYVNYQTSVVDLNVLPVPGIWVWSGKEKGFKLGWTVGAGGEYQVTEKLTFKVDGLYYSLADSSAAATGNADVQTAGLGALVYESKIKNNGAIGRIGVNYRF